MPTTTSIPFMTQIYRGDLIAGIIISVIAIFIISYWVWRKELPWYKAVRGAKITRENAVMDLEAVLGTPRMPAREVEPPQELQHIAPMQMAEEQCQSRVPPTKLQTIQEAAMPESKLSQSAMLVASTDSSASKDPYGDITPSVKSDKSNSSNDSFRTARTEAESEPFPEFGPHYHPSNDLADYTLMQLQSASVHDSHASDSTGTTLGTMIEIGEAVPMRMTSLSPRRLSDA
jgi:hypothetical protein